MRSDPDFKEYHSKFSEAYERNNYNANLTGFVMKQGHVCCEKDFGPSDYFETVVEVGSGTGVHLDFIRHRAKTYYLTDGSDEMLALAKEKHGSKKNDFDLVFQKENATKLSFADGFCDRLIATHVLEHLLNPHEILREWVRVIKPGGILTLLLPCDPGMAWRLGRTLIVRKNYATQNIPYDYWMAREHVNPINNLIAFIEYYFTEKKVRWYPFPIASIDLNLFYVCHIKV